MSKSCGNCGLEGSIGCPIRDHQPDMISGCGTWEEDMGQSDVDMDFDEDYD